MNNKVVMQITTTEVKKQKFKNIAKCQGYTVSGLVNKLIDEYIKKNGDK